MKKIRFMLFAVVVMAAASCAQEIASENQNAVQVNYVDMEFTSSLEGMTKTQLDGNKVIWTGKEAIAILDNSASPANTQATTVSGNPGVFTASVPEATEYYACYPYRADYKLSGSKLTTCYLPQVQSPAKGSFDIGRTPMIAKMNADNNLEFKNILSHIKFTIPSDMTDVIALTLIGNDNELLTGTFDVEWNNGDPVIYPASNADTYATLRSASKGKLTPGDYYFSIFPTEFKNGFVVILSKENGTQVAIRTDKARTEVSERNNILPMKEVASSAFKSHMNYFVHYDNGFDLEFGGLKFNNTTDGFTKAKLYSNTKPVDMLADGIYFIMPGTTADNAKISASREYAKLAIIGADASVRSDICLQNGVNLSLKAAGTHLLLANLKCDLSTSGSQLIRGDIGTFGDVVISNCAFPEIPNNFINCDRANVADVVLNWNSFVIEDSELGFSGTGERYLIQERTPQSKIETVTFNNNIFYSCKGVTGMNFILLFGYDKNGNGLDIDTYTMNNNTFVFSDLFTRISYVHGLTTFYCNQNLFVTNTTANTNIIYLSSTGDHIEAGKAWLNFFYDTDSASDKGVFIDKGFLAAGTAFAHSHAYALSVSPLSTLWEPANGKFGAYTITPKDSSKDPGKNKIGAQRADMTPESAELDSPSNDYTEDDLGSI